MTTEKNSTHSPTYCASKTGIPKLWIVNLIEIAKVLIEKKKEEEEETRRTRNNPKIFQIFSNIFQEIFNHKYIISGFGIINNNYSPNI